MSRRTLKIVSNAISRRSLVFGFCLILNFSISCSQDFDSRAIQSSVSIPIGAILPVGNNRVDAMFKLALKRHNAQVVLPFSPSSLGSQPNLRFRVFLQTSVINDTFTMAQEFCNHMSQRTHTIIGFWKASSMNAIISYSDTFNIPWITPSLPLPDQPTKHVINLHPKFETFLLDFLFKLGWKEFTLVYDQKEVHLPVKAAIAFCLERGLRIQVRNLAGVDNILPTLKEIACKKEYKVLFDVSLQRSMQTLEKIKIMGMLSMDYHYIFSDLSLIDQDLRQFAYGASNLTFLGLVDKSFELYDSVLQGQTNPFFNTVGSESALIYDAFTAMASGMRQVIAEGLVFETEIQDEINRVERVTCHQMSILPLNTGSEISKAIKEVKFQGLTGNVEFDQQGQRINYSVRIYALDRLGLNSIGTWTDSSEEGDGILELNDVDLVDQSDWILESYRNETLIVTTIVEEPYVIRKPNWQELEGNDRFEGFCVDLLKEITKIAQIQYRIKPVDDGQYGSKNDKDGTWNGMIGEVKYQKAHMAVAPLTITSAREAVVDFTKPFMTLGISIMIKKPEKQNYNIFSFLDPLSTEIWICIVFAYVGVSVVLYLVSRFSPYEWHRRSLTKVTNNDEIDAATDFGIFNSLWFSLGAFVQQGCDISPKSFSGRIVGGVWWLFTLIVISSYTANLAAFLTVDKMVTPIAGAEDLAKQTLIQYGTLRSGSTVNFFKQSPLPTYEKMWATMKSQEPSVFVSSNKEGIARVRASDGKYAFLMESTLNDYTEQRRPCNTMKVGPNIDSKGYGIALPKGSPLYDTVNLAILTLREQGKLQKLKNYWWYDKSECGANGGSGATKTPALTLGNVAGVFYVLIGGMGLAICTALLEFWYHAHKIRNFKRKQKAKAAARDRLLAERSVNISTTDNIPSVGGDHESAGRFKFWRRK
uniref:glutamate receptor 2-like isoform X1 n=2 Tax=Ciona intestinalis TaxID=7719 RepID=UPI00089DD107|nr:glutamate receptor 2-like isoform X1 [Ciona intestinalis]|eukprot:XP_018672579.1 glutamate receptor 2-like isoform X1 [Ciona intestinalis]